MLEWGCSQHFSTLFATCKWVRRNFCGESAEAGGRMIVHEFLHQRAWHSHGIQLLRMPNKYQKGHSIDISSIPAYSSHLGRSFGANDFGHQWSDEKMWGDGADFALWPFVAFEGWPVMTRGMCWKLFKRTANDVWIVAFSKCFVCTVVICWPFGGKPWHAPRRWNIKGVGRVEFRA